MDSERANNLKLHEKLVDGVKQISKNIIIPALGSEKDASISTLIFPGLKSENLIIGLDIEGIAVSAGPLVRRGKLAVHMFTCLKI